MKQLHILSIVKQLYHQIEYLIKCDLDEDINAIINVLTIKKSELKNQPKNFFFTLCETNKLSNFEEWLLFLALCFEFEPRIIYFLSKHCSNKHYLSFRLLEPICELDINPINSILFYDELIYMDKKSGFPLIDASLRLSENIIHFALNNGLFNPKLAILLKPVDVLIDFPMLPNTNRLLDSIKNMWEQDKASLLIGNDEGLQEIIILKLKDHLRRELLFIDVSILPDNFKELESCITFLKTETRLNHFIYCFSFHNYANHNEEENFYMLRFLSLAHRFLHGSYLLLSNHDFTNVDNSLIKVNINKPSREEWKSIWNFFLGKKVELSAFKIDEIIEHFELTVNQIKDLAKIILKNPSKEPAKALWNLCRVATRLNTTNLLLPLKTTNQWEQLVLPLHQKQKIEQLIEQVRNRWVVYREWGLGHQTRGLGITALFFGSSGTGKTMAAEAIAEKLELDLYRIDLSQVVSKYIGETQKNLEKVFKLAEKSSAILLFDEADSLFAKRSDTKDSRDRYSNMEISYLLSRMENYRGVSLLTSNLKGNIDNAFLRRFRFVIEFYYPSERERVLLWNKLITSELPCDNIDIEKLAKVDISGASIRDVLINAAFNATANKTKQITMQHFKQAMQQEFIKLERPFTEALNDLI